MRISRRLKTTTMTMAAAALLLSAAGCELPVGSTGLLSDPRGQLTAHLAGATAAAGPEFAPADSAEAQTLNLLNAERSRQGLAGLTLDAGLSAAARRQAEAMANAQGLSHQDLAPLLGLGYSRAGENVGAGGDLTAIHHAFLASASHAANIANDAFRMVGIAAVTDGGGRLWICEVFAG